MEKHVGNVEKWGGEWGKCNERGMIRWVNGDEFDSFKVEFV